MNNELRLERKKIYIRILWPKNWITDIYCAVHIQLVNLLLINLSPWTLQMLADVATWDIFFSNLKHKSVINVSSILFRENQRPSDGKK